MKSKIGILTFGLIIVFAAAAHAWTITPELKQEIIDKQTAVENNINDPYAHFDLAITYAYSNRIAEGWNELKKTNQLDPRFAPEALKIFTAKVAAEPNNWKLRYRLAFALYFNGKKRAAIAEFKKILKTMPCDALSYGYIGLILGEMNFTDAAIQSIKKGISIDSNIAALHLLLSAAYYKKGDSWGGLREGSEAVRLKALGY
jgi:tetratricopeptide (TPR) repeat protein